MKKIGIVTYYSRNYGSILQCFATKYYLESLNIDCVVIGAAKESFVNRLINKFKFLVEDIILALKYKDFTEYKIRTKSALKVDIELVGSETSRKMDDFVKDMISPTFFKWNELKKIANDFDLFFVGSDQVWNGSTMVNDIFFLKFAPMEKRFTLSPSFGTDNIPRFNRNRMEKGLKCFNNITVREETGVSIVKELVGKNAVLLPDPTVLLSKSEWQAFASTGKTMNSDFVLVHFLNNPSQNSLSVIKFLSEQQKYKIVIIGAKYSCYDELDNTVMMDCDPYDYIALIDRAKCVVTDSFHTTLFSINLETSFFVYSRNYEHGYSQSSRITDLLKRYNLENRLDVGAIDSVIEYPNWRSDDLLRNEREQIKLYLNRISDTIKEE